MINKALNILNGTDIFTKKLPAIIETFVQYYGEENRPYIEERFNTLAPFCFNKPDEKKYIISQTLEELQRTYYQSFFTKHNLEFNQENANFYLPFNLSSPEYSLMEKYAEYVSRRQLSTEEKRLEAANVFISEIKRRYNLDVSYDTIISKKNTPELREFLAQFPEYMTQYINSAIADEYIDIKETRLIENIVEKLSKLDPSITVDNFNELYSNKTNPTIQKLNSMLVDYKEMKNLFAAEIEPLKPYIEYCEKCRKLQTEIEEKHFYNLILKYQDILPPSEIKIINEGLESNQPIALYNAPTISAYFGSNIHSEPLISAFSKKSQDILNKNEPKWKVDSIKYDRVHFFKNIGLDKGPNYEDYMSDPECLAHLPNENIIEELLDAKNTSREKATIEYYENLPDYKAINAQVTSLNLASNDAFNANLYENTLMCISPNVQLTETGPKVLPLAFFRLSYYDTPAIDAYIMHELNHVYELFLQEDHPEYTTFTSGWDIIEQPKNEKIPITLEKVKSQRSYELFNEMINELISQDITRLLHSNGIYLFTSPEKVKISHKTSYEQSVFIIRDFYETYIDDIKASRRSRDMTSLFARVGEENFNALNDLIHTFNNYFSNEFKLATTYKNRSEGKETEDTIMFSQILAKRNEIMARIHAHAKEYTATQSL